MTIEDPLLIVHGYKLLSIATSYLMGDNSDFDVLRCFIHCVWRGTYDLRRPITECSWLPIVGPSNQ